jgi:hypothetical protein
MGGCCLVGCAVAEIRHTSDVINALISGFRKPPNPKSDPLAANVAVTLFTCVLAADVQWSASTHNDDGDDDDANNETAMHLVIPPTKNDGDHSGRSVGLGGTFNWDFFFFFRTLPR